MAFGFFVLYYGDFKLMRITFTFLIFLLFVDIAFGQKELPKRLPGPPTKSEEAKMDLNYQCLHTSKYWAKQRKAFFPFSTAASIKLISFEAPEPPDVVIKTLGDATITAAPNRADTVEVITAAAPNKFVVNYRKVKEQRRLDAKSVDELTDILYNVGYTPVKGISLQAVHMGSGCYMPRNAILFLDASGTVTQYIEFCFECERYFYSSTKTKPVVYCEQKFQMLSNFFVKQGIGYVKGKKQE